MNKKSATIAMLMISLMSANAQPTQVQAGASTTQSVTTQAIKKLNKTMYATTALNVRDKPSAKGKKIGSLPYGKKVIVTGRDSNTGWYRIKYNGGIGFVSGSYLSSKKPSSGSTSKPSTGKPSTSKPSKPSTSKPEGNYHLDCNTWDEESQADCDELASEDDVWW